MAVANTLAYCNAATKGCKNIVLAIVGLFNLDFLVIVLFLKNDRKIVAKCFVHSMPRLKS
jgi:hypothetical protein